MKASEIFENRVSYFLSEDITVTISGLNIQEANTYVYRVYLNYGTQKEEEIFIGNVFLLQGENSHEFHLNDLLSNYKWDTSQMLPNKKTRRYNAVTDDITITAKVAVMVEVGNSIKIGTTNISLIYDYPNFNNRLLYNSAFEDWSNWASGNRIYNLLQGYSDKEIPNDILIPRVPFIRTDYYPLIWTTQNNTETENILKAEGRLSEEKSLGVKTKGNKCNRMSLATAFMNIDEVPDGGYANQFRKNFHLYSNFSSRIFYNDGYNSMSYTSNTFTLGNTYDLTISLLGNGDNVIQETNIPIKYDFVKGHIEFDLIGNDRDTIILKFSFNDDSGSSSIQLYEYTFGKILSSRTNKLSFDYYTELEGDDDISIELENIVVACKTDYKTSATKYSDYTFVSTVGSDISYDSTYHEIILSNIPFIDSPRIKLQVGLTDRNDRTSYLELKNGFSITQDVFNNYICLDLPQQIEGLKSFSLSFLITGSIATINGISFNSVPKDVNRIFIPYVVQRSGNTVRISLMYPIFSQVDTFETKNLDYGLLSIFNGSNLNNYYCVAKVDMCPSRYYLLWQDRFGSFQSQPFEKGNVFSENISNSEISNYRNERYKIQSEVQPKWEINTGWIDEKLYPFYESIFVSPYLILYDSVEDINYTVLVTDKDYTEKTFKNQGRKLFNLKLNLEKDKTQKILY